MKWSVGNDHGSVASAAISGKSFLRDVCTHVISLLAIAEPDQTFRNLATHDSPINISELHKILRSPDFGTLKFWNARLGSSRNNTRSREIINNSVSLRGWVRENKLTLSAQPEMACCIYTDAILVILKAFFRSGTTYDTTTQTLDPCFPTRFPRDVSNKIT